MNARKRIGLFVVALLTTAGTLAVAAPATGTPAQGTKPDMCTLPVSERAGGWMCPDKGMSETLMLKETGAAPLTGGVRKLMVTGDGVAGVCLTTGCWNIYNSAKTIATAYVSGWFGYSGTTLGSVSISTKDGMNGRQTVTSVQSFKPNRSVYNTQWHTERLYVSGTCTGGCLMSPRSYVDSAYVSVCGGCTFNFAPQYTWGATAYAATYHRIKWSVSGYPGYWYSRHNSVKAKLVGTQYYYEGTFDDPSLTSTPLSSGYSG